MLIIKGREKKIKKKYLGELWRKKKMCIHNTYFMYGVHAHPQHHHDRGRTTWSCKWNDDWWCAGCVKWRQYNKKRADELKEEYLTSVFALIIIIIIIILIGEKKEESCVVYLMQIINSEICAGYTGGVALLVFYYAFQTRSLCGRSLRDFFSLDAPLSL